MGWFRSEEMLYASLAVDKDIAHRVVHRLGRLGAVEFIDVRAAAIRPPRAAHAPARDPLRS